MVKYPSSMFRKLSEKEEDEFREWARSHVRAEDIETAKKGLSHPVVRDEYRKMGLLDEEIFNFKQRECLRLLKDYDTTFAMDEIFAHECNKHDDQKACEMHEFTAKKLEEIKKEAEHCGWTETLTIMGRSKWVN